MINNNINLNDVLTKNLEALWNIDTATFVNKHFDIDFTIALIKTNSELDISEFVDSFGKFLRPYDKIFSITNDFVFVLFSYSNLDKAHGAIDRSKKDILFKDIGVALLEINKSNNSEANFQILITEAFKNNLGNLS